MKTSTSIIRTLATGAVLATGTFAVTVPVAGATETATGCPSEAWPASVNGRPAAHAEATGVYLWHTDTGWKLRVNEPGADRAAFTGTIRVDGRLVSWGCRLERGAEGVLTRGA